MRLLAPFKATGAQEFRPNDRNPWGQLGPQPNLPAPTDDLGRDAPPILRPQARASWQPLVADIGNPWFRVPQEQNLRLFEQLAETIPVLSRAMRCITQLVGIPYVEADDATKAEITQWMNDVVVNRVTTGFGNWVPVWIYDSLLYGRSHAEIVPLQNLRDIYAIQELHTRTIDLRPTLDGYNLDIVQIMAMRGMWITLNKRLIVTATHELAGDMPHGRSLLWGLPFVGEIVTSMCKDQKRLWERFGDPFYHIRYMPPANMPDPTAAKSQGFIDAIMGLFNTAMQARANGETQDFGTSGDIEVRVIGAAGEQLKFVEPMREFVSQIISKTGLPPFLLGMQWQTTETMSAVEGGLLSQMIDQIRAQLEPELYYLIRLRQLLAGKSDKFKICWQAPTLIDLFEQARADLFRGKADAQMIANDEDLWRIGVIDQFEFARRHRADLKDKTDPEIAALCPNLLEEPPAPSPQGQGFGAELMPDQAGGAGSGQRSLTYGPLVKNGNGRH